MVVRALSNRNGGKHRPRRAPCAPAPFLHVPRRSAPLSPAPPAQVSRDVPCALRELRAGGRGWAGAIGFGCSLGFLLFVFKFNEYVQAYKARKNIRKGQKLDASLLRALRSIFGKACTRREYLTIGSLCMSLLARTLGSVWVSKHWGRIVKALVTKDFGAMKRLVLQFAGGTVALAVLNALLKFYISTLREQVREKVTAWCHRQYLRDKDMIFYKANKVGDFKIENCDHQITSDVDKFSETFASVLSQSLKPVVDFVVYTVELSRVQGLTTPLTLYGWFAFASALSTVTLPPYGELAAEEQRLEGRFRASHAELITNCEQVAFLGGERPEKAVIDAKFGEVLAHQSKTRSLNFNSEMVRQYLNKYFVTVIGLYLVAQPVRGGGGAAGALAAASSEEISQYFVSTWRNMEAMATAIQDLFELTKCGPASLSSLVLAPSSRVPPRALRPRSCMPCVRAALAVRGADVTHGARRGLAGGGGGCRVAAGHGQQPGRAPGRPGEQGQRAAGGARVPAARARRADSSGALGWLAARLQGRRQPRVRPRLRLPPRRYPPHQGLPSRPPDLIKASPPSRPPSSRSPLPPACPTVP